MAKKSYDDLKQFVLDAWETETAERSKWIGATPNPGSGWPQVSPEVISGNVVREQGSLAQSRRELLWRFRSIRYPYRPPDEPRHRASKTFLRQLRELGLLSAVTRPPLLYQIRMVWFFGHYYEQEDQDRTMGVSQVGYSLKFHRQMMLEIWRHKKRIEKLAHDASVKDDWLAEYEKATQKQILKDARNYYPQFLEKFRPANRIPIHSHEVDMRVELFHALERAFKKRGISNSSFCAQLTAVICTSRRNIRKRFLLPAPNKILTNVRDENKNRRISVKATKKARN